MIGTVPVYDSVIHYQRDLATLTAQDFVDVVRLHAEDGVDFVTLHCGITRKTIEQIKKHKRKMNIVSRGGSLVFAWMCMTGEENPFYEHFDEILDICEEYGVRLDALEQKAVKLLHSKTGACIAREVFGQPQAVYDAIFWHTTGKADMTTLEKVLYIADYMEPNRDFDGVERLRHLAYTDLDKAMLLGVEMTIQEMQQRQVPIHTNTLQARDWLRQHGVTTED